MVPLEFDMLFDSFQSNELPALVIKHVLLSSYYLLEILIHGLKIFSLNTRLLIIIFKLLNRAIMLISLLQGLEGILYILFLRWSLALENKRVRFQITGKRLLPQHLTDSLRFICISIPRHALLPYVLLYFRDMMLKVGAIYHLRRKHI